MRSNELEKNIKFLLQADMRHKGQGHEILVDIKNEDIIKKNINVIKNNFYNNYEKVYGYSHKKLDIEITKLRLKAIGKTPKFNITALRRGIIESIAQENFLKKINDTRKITKIETIILMNAD